jgi:hypothetical protein
MRKERAVKGKAKDMPSRLRTPGETEGGLIWAYLGEERTVRRVEREADTDPCGQVRKKCAKSRVDSAKIGKNSLINNRHCWLRKRKIVKSVAGMIYAWD